MKKVLSLVLVTILLLSGLFVLTGCGEKEVNAQVDVIETQDTNTDDSTNPTNPYVEDALNNTTDKKKITDARFIVKFSERG